jgi:hypothetical protein
MQAQKCLAVRKHLRPTQGSSSLITGESIGSKKVAKKLRTVSALILGCICGAARYALAPRTAVDVWSYTVGVR